ncbi:MAG TPA: SUMF1/EgtB/PvdO family nonheme iron enzyme [Terriglobia bacterium]
MATAAAVTGIERQGQLLHQLAESRARTDALFRIVRPEALYDRPIAERHRIVFYIGHLEAFDLNLLVPALGVEPFQPEFDRLFAFGIDPVDGGLPQDQPSDWPRRDEVTAYVHRVRTSLDECLSRPRMGSSSGLSTLLHVAVEHRLMHAETLAYMFHQLPLERKIAQPEPRQPEARVVSPRMIEIPPGVATLGRSRGSSAAESEESFGWDNEFEAITTDVPGFGIDAYNVTNRQFLEFIRAGGYNEKSLWSPADWQWLQSEAVRHPRFWVANGNGRGQEWSWRTMFDERPLPLDWPVYVSHAEASAYARWQGKALPTEAQFHRAAYGSPKDGAPGEREYPWGEEPPGEGRGNFDLGRWDPVAVGSYPAGRSAFGIEDLIGNGWEWTASAFAPFPGFQPFSFYPGYSANFFDGKHYVVKGGSSRTAARMLRRSFRNWFQPHYPFVYATFRCASQ